MVEKIKITVQDHRELRLRRATIWLEVVGLVLDAAILVALLSLLWALR